MPFTTQEDVCIPIGPQSNISQMGPMVKYRQPTNLPMVLIIYEEQNSEQPR